MPRKTLIHPAVRRFVSTGVGRFTGPPGAGGPPEPKWYSLPPGFFVHNTLPGNDPKTRGRAIALTRLLANRS